jgi:hypothetical protein
MLFEKKNGSGRRHGMAWAEVVKVGPCKDL